MDQTKIEAQADYISMDLTTKVLNQTLSINEAMYSLVLSTTYLLSRTLPKEAFDSEAERSKNLAHEVVNIINKQISKDQSLNPARIMLSLNLVMELVMEGMQCPK